MFFRKRTAGMSRAQNRRPVILLVTAVLMLLLTACSGVKGGILIFEDFRGKGCTMEFEDWETSNKCELSLSGNDVLQVELTLESGALALSVSGKKGSEPYAGKNLQPGVFTVTVSETDEYIIAVTGERASGRLAVKNLGNPQSK